MKGKLLILISGIALSSFVLSSCDTPTGAGAGYGAAAGAIIARATKVMKLIDALEDLDDTDAVHANFDVDAEILERVAG